MENCIFCSIIQGKAPAWKVYEDEHTLAFFDIAPAAEYHTLVIPKVHYMNIFDLPEEELAHVSRTVKKVSNHYKEKLGIDNIQIICSSGREAQQDVFHCHFHILPRKTGDGQNVRWRRRNLNDENFKALLDRLSF